MSGSTDEDASLPASSPAALQLPPAALLTDEQQRLRREELDLAERRTLLTALRALPPAERVALEQLRLENERRRQEAQLEQQRLEVALTSEQRLLDLLNRGILTVEQWQAERQRAERLAAQQQAVPAAGG